MPFKKGQSGNPSGRPNDSGLKELCRARTAKAVQTLAEIMANKKSPAAARVAAACALLDRGYGKPAQAIVGADGKNAVFRLEAPWLERVAKARGWV
jgi:hypothetical protein